MLVALNEKIMYKKISDLGCEVFALTKIRGNNATQIHVSKTSPSKKEIGDLPEFLYLDKGRVKSGVHGDEDVTKEWIEFKKTKQ